MTRYSVIGLGKLGASIAAAIASRGFHVIGVDVLQKAVDQINAGHAPVQETGLEEMIAANKERLHATINHREAILNTDVSFVIVPTPSDEQGAFSLQYAAFAFREIGRALSEKKSYHLIVLTSTVLPGATRYGLLPILEHESGKKAGKDFGLCYSPEFIALGSVISDFLNPDFTLAGQSDDKAGSLLESCYAQIIKNGAPCKRMSIENAELTKISLNSFVTMKITFANMLVDLCERIPGADVDIVADALGCDKRIGHKYLKGAIGYGGPCFPRDNIALAWIARKLGSKADLAETTHLCNRALPGKVVERLRPLIKNGETVAILGLAYKPFSNVIEESQGIELARALSDAGARVIGYDTLAAETARVALADYALVLNSLADCLEQADVVLVTTPDPAFISLKRSDFRRNPVTVVDFWRILDRELSAAPGICYIPIGHSIDNEANAARLDSFWGSSKENRG
jgi:UDPglucose 6-dehydrogenase